MNEFVQAMRGSRWEVGVMLLLVTCINYVDRQVLQIEFNGTFTQMLAVMAPALKQSFCWTTVEYGNPFQVVGMEHPFPACTSFLHAGQIISSFQLADVIGSLLHGRIADR